MGSLHVRLLLRTDNRHQNEGSLLLRVSVQLWESDFYKSRHVQFFVAQSRSILSVNDRFSRG